MLKQLKYWQYTRHAGARAFFSLTAFAFVYPSLKFSILAPRRSHKHMHQTCNWFYFISFHLVFVQDHHMYAPLVQLKRWLVIHLPWIAHSLDIQLNSFDGKNQARNLYRVSLSIHIMHGFINGVAYIAILMHTNRSHAHHKAYVWEKKIREGKWNLSKWVGWDCVKKCTYVFAKMILKSESFWLWFWYHT